MGKKRIKAIRSFGIKGAIRLPKKNGLFLIGSLLLFLVALPVTLGAIREQTQTKQQAASVYPDCHSPNSGGPGKCIPHDDTCANRFPGSFNDGKRDCPQNPVVLQCCIGGSAGQTPGGGATGGTATGSQGTTSSGGSTTTTSSGGGKVYPQCGNCAAGGSCGTSGQYCEKQVGCYDANVAVNQVFQCSGGKWQFKYNQNGGSCTAQGCGNQCRNCSPGGSCSKNGQYCENQTGCSGTTPTNQVLQCTNGKWEFKYNQNGGSCTRNCSGSSAQPTPTPLPYRNFGACAGLSTDQSLCTDASYCTQTNYPYEHASKACSGTNNGKMVRCCVKSGLGGYNNYGTCAGLSASESLCTDADRCSQTNFPYEHTSNACGGTRNGKRIHCCATKPG